MPIKVSYNNLTLEDRAGGGIGIGNLKKLMCRDSSWGTYVENLSAAATLCGAGSLERWRGCEPRLEDRDGPESPSFDLYFPNDNFDFLSEGVDHFVATVAGDVVAYTDIKGLEVSDFEFIDRDVSGIFPGPGVGIDSFYNDWFARKLKGTKRPLVAFTVKPRLGLSVDDLEKLFLAADAGGIDIVEDDERLIDPLTCRFHERIRRISKLQKPDGAIYSVNITGDLETAYRRLSQAYSFNIRMVKFDVLVGGFETLRRLALRARNELGSKIAITVYPDAYRTFRRLGRKFILRLSRLCGADIVYAGSPGWIRYAGEGTLKQAEDVLMRHKMLSEALRYAPATQRSLPTLSNDQHPCAAELLTAFFKTLDSSHHQYAFFVGGGISAFPGTFQEAVSTYMACIEHASRWSPSTKYSRFNFDKYEEGFRKNGWDQFDIEKLLNK